MFPISAHVSVLLNVLLSLFGGCFISLLLRTRQQILGQYTHSPIAAFPAGGFSPKASILFILLYSGSDSLSCYHIISTPQTISTYSALFLNQFQLMHLACFQQDNIPH